ncbi:MAG: hypothetical protein WCA07_03905 [Gloeobacterales cyanobacterium]
MKSIKKIVAASTLVMTLFSFSFNVEPAKAEGLVCLLFGCKKAVVKDIDLLYGDPPDYDNLYGKEPPEPQDYNPNGPSPYGWYGNQLENIMGRDIREIIELDKRRYKRIFESGIADDKILHRSAYILPFGELEKSLRLDNRNTAYIFEYSANIGGPGTPDKQEPRIISVPFDNYTYGTQTIYGTIPGTPATPDRHIQ